MVRRKGELSNWAIDTGSPYQVALPAGRCTGPNYPSCTSSARACRSVSGAKAFAGMTPIGWYGTSPIRSTPRDFSGASAGS
jgi:hypothetical protein